jgi:chromatin remodeling complex protein RSC6
MSSTTSHSTTNMSAAKKTVTKKTSDAPAPATPAPAPAAVVEDKKARAPRKTAAAKAEVVVPVAAAPAAPVAAAPAESPSLATVVERLREVQARVSADLKAIVKDTLAATKAAAREVKDAKRKRRVKKDVSEMTEEERKVHEERRAKNAFLKPRALTPELSAFMGLPAGSQRSQTEVTKFVSNYVKTHGCFDPANKRRIIADGALSRLLKVTDKDTVTYLNLQSFLKVHFVKA